MEDQDLRDQFAMAALNGLSRSDDDTTATDLANMAYAIADAMMAERAKSQPAETGDADLIGSVENDLINLCDQIEDLSNSMVRSRIDAILERIKSAAAKQSSERDEFAELTSGMSFSNQVLAMQHLSQLADKPQSSELPERRWALKATTGNSDLRDQFTRQNNGDVFHNSCDGEYLNGIDNKPGCYEYDPNILPGHTPITDDQFRRLVLKKS